MGEWKGGVGGEEGSFGVCVCGEDREKRSNRQQGRPVGERGRSLRRDREDWEMSSEDDLAGQEAEQQTPPLGRDGGSVAGSQDGTAGHC